MSRYGVIDKSIDDEKKYNIFNRPPKSSLAPSMALAKNAYQETSWDDVMGNLAKWLIRHLNNPDLILFMVRQGGRLDQRMKRLISYEIKEQAQKRKERNSQYFEQLNLNSPDRIVSDEMNALWSVVLAGYTEPSEGNTDLYSWVQDYKLFGINISLKKSIRSILSPRVTFKTPFRFNQNDRKLGIKSHINWDIEVASSLTHSALENLNESEAWHEESHELIQEFTFILIELMELKSTLGDIDHKTDYSYISRPSIKEHTQNNNYHNWTVLIDLVKDSWLSLNYHDSTIAIDFVNKFWKQPYPIFKRIAFFCASESKDVPIETIITWLSIDSGYWLWNVSTQREVLQLLRNIHKKASNEQYEDIIKLILSGPQRDWFKENLSKDDFDNSCSRAIWLRLEKLQQDGGKLNQEAINMQELILASNPKWKLSDDDRDEFPFWTGTGNEPKFVISSPKDKESLVDWLKEEKEDNFWTEDDWSIRCQDDFEIASEALKDLALGNQWLVGRWREAIQIWSESEKLKENEDVELFLFIMTAPDNVLLELSWQLTTWLKKMLSKGVLKDEVYLSSFDKLAHLPYEIDIDDTRDPINAAINNPVGILVESIFSWWYSTSPKDDEGLTNEFKSRLVEVCNLDNKRLYFGRVIVCANLLSLFKVDRKWAKDTVIPWLSWDDVPNSSMAWQSLLWSPRLHKGFILEIKDDLIETAYHYELLEKLGKQYVTFMTYLSLQGYSEFKVGDLANVFNEIPTESLYSVATALKDSLSSSGDKIDEFWHHRTKPFLMKIWPKQAKIDNNTIGQLSLICIAAKHNFPEAYSIIKHNLSYLDDAEYVLRQLYSSDLIETNPNLSLEFIGKIIGEPKYLPPTKLEPCLFDIEKFGTEVINNADYIRLKTIVNRFK